MWLIQMFMAIIVNSKKILQPLVNCEDRIVEQLFTTYLNNDQIVQPQSEQCGVSNIQ